MVSNMVIHATADIMQTGLSQPYHMNVTHLALEMIPMAGFLPLMISVVAHTE